MKFRRKQSEPDVEAADASSEPALEVTGVRARGPWDADEVTLDEDDPGKLDLGSLVVTPREGLDLQLQVDEQTGQVVAVVLAGQEGALELRAFAAPRNGDIWPDVRKQIASEITRRGGTATEAEGPYGPELRVVLNVTAPDGRTGQQPSRVFGITGPRWLLRATLFGQPALDPSDDGLVESALRDVVVRRGGEPHAPGEALPLTVPHAVAQQMQAAQQQAREQADARRTMDS
ncbi:DUF3710 domain-containing protein [Nocardioides iriomotensis]|uniref:DUF3710 domain-containing protein n=1 Tax=Nocardioides iriomotensis TaxID=715784 RepID=A0A4Q5J0Z5_9ACTN|nr:DUF3710 domain-containing protein [Nocardioides iriomotensis]RYU11973.1 DUF3710 domain-containing protein [Nocardioides iriomotensis]